MTETIAVRIKRLPNGLGLALPGYASQGAAGMDVLAAERVDLEPGSRTLVATGFAVAIPEGFEIQVRPRSGLALKAGLTVPNTPGTIDCDYRGEVKIMLGNTSKTKVIVERGDRIAQLVLARVPQATWIEVETLDETARGEGGFGSTGT